MEKTEDEYEYITEDDIREDVTKAIELIEVFIESSYGYGIDWHDWDDAHIKREALRLMDEIHAATNECRIKRETGKLQ